MTTRELIAMLNQQDPEGNMPIELWTTDIPVSAVGVGKDRRRTRLSPEWKPIKGDMKSDEGKGILFKEEISVCIFSDRGRDEMGYRR